MSSPYAGQVVATAGNVVTAVGPAGFFIATPPARSDNDPATSDGIYVYQGRPPAVTAGDIVDVTGTVSEYHGMTEIGGGVTVRVVASGGQTPPPVELNDERPSPVRPQPENELERFEGMLVHVAHGTVTGPTDRRGAIAFVASDTRTFREPGIVWPGVAGLPVWDGNPELLFAELGAFGAAAPAVPAGACIDDLVGPLAEYDGAYEVWPTAFRFTGTPAARPVRTPALAELTVATQNMYQLFDDVADGSETVVSADEYARRLAKHSRLIREVLRSPDMLVVQEVENLRVLQDLAARIHQDDPQLSYAGYLVPGNDPSGINVGLLSRDTVTVKEVRQVGKDETFTCNGTTYLTHDRPPLVMDATFASGGTSFPLTVIAVHLRSLSGIDGNSADFVRAKRAAQSLSLARLVQSLQTADPAEHLVVAGDFNAFEFTDGYVDVLGQITGSPDPLGSMAPVEAVVTPSLTDWTRALPPAERYSFVELGNAQALDHILTSQALAGFVTGVAYARADADAPVALETDAATALRAADHDGMVLYLSPLPVHRPRRQLHAAR
jgi:predicted extracellular nuclease